MHKKNSESVFENTLGGREVHLEKWTLAYSPYNPVLENLMNMAVDSLDLAATIGVNSSDELANIIVNRDLVAGVEFHHSSVNVSSF